ncbi:hypothetical protein BY996DRAFT_6414658 [Phakopsora pachyrhizi]|nr:hypothetical protein BY996DRAFT_6414658 [Phakopsora pachyrhizi]
MSAQSALATSSRVCFPTNCSAALKVLMCSESSVGFQAVMVSKNSDLQVAKSHIHSLCQDSHDQNIANLVSSGFQRATKSVGLATPTYYANLVASRAKNWDMSDDNGSKVFTTNSGTQTPGKRQHKFYYFKNRINKMNEKVNLISHQM